jgi:hypothetical protein
MTDKAKQKKADVKKKAADNNPKGKDQSGM